MISVFSQEKGAGKSILLLHGFPFHQAIWNDFSQALSENFHVITVDLPGFGQSPLLPDPFAIDDVADTLLEFLSSKKLTDIALVGHSLGGYIALAMVQKALNTFSSLTLFHSTAYADSQEKKESRLKVVDFVKRNGALPFTSGFIPPLFADQTHPAIKTVQSIASGASAEAVIGYSLAMKDRPDRVKTLESFKNPTLFLAGKNDGGIPVDSVLEQARRCQKPEIHVLDNVAHMGMFEKPAETRLKITDFVLKTYA